MKKSEILKKVKKHLWGGSYRKHWSFPEDYLKGNKFKYLCHALKTINRTKSSSCETLINCDMLIDFVERSLDGCDTYEVWLHTNHRNTYIRMDSHDFQEGRKQWLEWMIQYFESNGE